MGPEQRQNQVFLQYAMNMTDSDLSLNVLAGPARCARNLDGEQPKGHGRACSHLDFSSTWCRRCLLMTHGGFLAAWRSTIRMSLMPCPGQSQRLGNCSVLMALRPTAVHGL